MYTVDCETCQPKATRVYSVYESDVLATTPPKLVEILSHVLPDDANLTTKLQRKEGTTHQMNTIITIVAPDHAIAPSLIILEKIMYLLSQLTEKGSIAQIGIFKVVVSRGTLR